MISRALSPSRPFDLILVYNFSRFYRDEAMQELYVRKLEESGVFLRSVTEDFGEHSEMPRRFLALMYELENKRRAQVVTHNMHENARQGFWNGSIPPLGYEAVEAEVRGDRSKKKLAVNTAEAEVVRLIFHLYLNGDGRGPMGLKAIADHLNRKGLRNRRGGRFSTGFLSSVLTRTTYISQHYYNTVDSRTRRPRDRSEWIEVPGVPAIIDREMFDAVQKELERRAPSHTPPRIINSPTLLTGLLKCGYCGGGMTLATGKGGKYRYYKCSATMRMGETACKGLSFPMKLVDDLVIHHLVKRLFNADRLESVLGALLKRTKESQFSRRDQIKSLRKQAKETRKQLDRLYKGISEGHLELEDTLAANINELTQKHDEELRLTAMAERSASIPLRNLSDKHVAAFIRSVESRLRSRDSAFRKACLRQFIERIEVTHDQIRISGSENAITGALLDDAVAKKGPVPSFDREWWSHGESNPGPLECHSSALPTELWPQMSLMAGSGAQSRFPRTKFLSRHSAVLVSSLAPSRTSDISSSSLRSTSSSMRSSSLSSPSSATSTTISPSPSGSSFFVAVPSPSTTFAATGATFSAGGGGAGGGAFSTVATKDVSHFGQTAGLRLRS